MSDNLPDMKVGLREALVLFVIGAVVAPFGDHAHVVTGTTRYLTDTGPFIWDVPLWFAATVGVGTVLAAEMRLRLGPPRSTVTARHAVAGIAAVIGIYMLTALLNDAQIEPTTALIVALAAVTGCVLADRPAVLVGLGAAVLGPAVEALQSAGDLFEYNDNSDGLFGVAPWLPALYFAFGVTASVLAEYVTSRR